MRTEHRRRGGAVLCLWKKAPDFFNAASFFFFSLLLPSLTQIVSSENVVRKKKLWRKTAQEGNDEGFTRGFWPFFFLSPFFFSSDAGVLAVAPPLPKKKGKASKQTVKRKTVLQAGRYSIYCFPCFDGVVLCSFFIFAYSCLFFFSLYTNLHYCSYCFLYLVFVSFFSPFFFVCGEKKWVFIWCVVNNKKQKKRKKKGV